jgi:hypothetical protein
VILALLGSSIITVAECARAQTELTLPVSRAATEGNTLLGFPFTREGRWQLLIHRSQLVPLGKGWALGEVWFRRDMPAVPGDRRRMSGGSLFFHIEGSGTDADPRAPSTVYAINHGSDRKILFAGEVQVPDCDPAASLPAPWTPPYALRIPFTTPLPDAGKNLCLEFVVQRVGGKTAPDFWVTDAEWFPMTAASHDIGTACRRTGQQLLAVADRNTLRPGATASFRVVGPILNPCLHALGLSDRWLGSIPLPFDLTPHGAPGCALYVDWLLLSAHLTDAESGWPLGRAEARFDLPLDQNLLGARLYSQWLFIDPGQNPLGLTTTNGIEARLESTLPVDGLGIVYSHQSTDQVGWAITHTFPVLRLVTVK